MSSQLTLAPARCERMRTSEKAGDQPELGHFGHLKGSASVYKTSQDLAVETVQPVTPENACDRWTADPRADLADDSTVWTLLLGIAYDADGDDPAGAFGVLHGLRCVGVGLERDERGRWRLVAGEVGAAEYEDIRREWLMPRRAQIGELLRRLEVAT